MTTTSVYADEVQDGIAWLDERVPDWRARIDIPSLDLSDGNKCILGQVFWEDAVRAGVFSGYFFVTALAWPNLDVQRFGFCSRSKLPQIGGWFWEDYAPIPDENGFHYVALEDQPDYVELRAEWVRVLEAAA